MPHDDCGDPGCCPDNPITNDFPKLGIKTQELISFIEEALADAFKKMRAGQDFGAVNWGDLGIADIQYRYSLVHPNEGPECAVLVEEADPGCTLAGWLNHKLLMHGGFPRVYVECEW